MNPRRLCFAADFTPGLFSTVNHNRNHRANCKRATWTKTNQPCPALQKNEANAFKKRLIRLRQKRCTRRRKTQDSATCGREIIRLFESKSHDTFGSGLFSRISNECFKGICRREAGWAEEEIWTKSMQGYDRIAT